MEDIFLAASLGDVESVSRRYTSSQLDAAHPQLGYSVLHAAVDFDRHSVVRFLLQNGFDPNSRRERQGRTPLHLAAARGSAGIAAILLDHGADATVRDGRGRRPHELAIEPSLRNSLRDPPPTVCGLRLVSVESRRIRISWLPALAVDSNVAPTTSYVIAWGQPKARVENPLYARAKAAYNVDFGNDIVSVRSVGSKLRHLRRRDRIRTFDPWKPKIRESVRLGTTRKHDEKQFVSSIENLFPATSYTISVRAKNSLIKTSGDPARLDDGFAETLRDSPEAPGQPFLVYATTKRVVVAWFPPRFLNGTPVTKYQIDALAVGDDRQYFWQTYFQADDKTNLFSVPASDECSKDYVIRVRARNEDGWSSWSPQSPVFRAVDSLRALNVETRSLELAWDSHAIKTESWEVQYRRENSTCEWTTVIDNVAPAQTVRVKLLSGGAHPLIPGDSYQFRVLPTSFLGGSGETSLVTTDFVKMKDDVPEKCLPPWRGEDCGGRFDISLAWKVGHGNGQPILDFELEQQDYVGCSSSHQLPCEYDIKRIDSKKITIVTNSPRAVISKIVPGQPIIFRVRSRNVYGFSEWSDPSEPIAVAAISAPSAPRLLDSGSTWLRVEWDPPSPHHQQQILAYNLYYKSNYTPDWCRCALPPQRDNFVAEPRAVVGDLRPARQFVLRVSASTLQGISPLSEPSPPFATTKRY